MRRVIHSPPQPSPPSKRTATRHHVLERALFYLCTAELPDFKKYVAPRTRNCVQTTWCLPRARTRFSLAASWLAYTGTRGRASVKSNHHRSFRDSDFHRASISRTDVTQMSRQFCLNHADRHVAMARARMLSEAAGSNNVSVTSYSRPMFGYFCHTRRPYSRHRNQPPACALAADT